MVCRLPEARFGDHLNHKQLFRGIHVLSMWVSSYFPENNRLDVSPLVRLQPRVRPPNRPSISSSATPTEIAASAILKAGQCQAR